jgi:hypothetical protein
MVPGSFTYTPENGDTRSQVRLLIGDTQQEATSFNDAEIDAFLTMEGNSTKGAAATAFTSWARSEAKVAQMIEQGQAKNSREAVQQLLALASDLRTGRIVTGGGGIAQNTNDGGYQAGTCGPSATPSRTCAKTRLGRRPVTRRGAEGDTWRPLRRSWLPGGRRQARKPPLSTCRKCAMCTAGKRDFGQRITSRPHRGSLSASIRHSPAVSSPSPAPARGRARTSWRPVSRQSAM